MLRRRNIELRFLSLPLKSRDYFVGTQFERTASVPGHGERALVAFDLNLMLEQLLVAVFRCLKPRDLELRAADSSYADNSCDLWFTRRESKRRIYDLALASIEDAITIAMIGPLASTDGAGELF